MRIKDIDSWSTQTSFTFKLSEVCSEHSQTSKMAFFVEIAHGFQA